MALHRIHSKDWRGRYAGVWQEIKKIAKGNEQKSRGINGPCRRNRRVYDIITRQAIRFKYVNGLTWSQVAANIGGGSTEEGLRKSVQRFFQEN